MQIKLKIEDQIKAAIVFKFLVKKKLAKIHAKWETLTDFQFPSPFNTDPKY